MRPTNSEPEAEHGGLSELGVQAIARINALGGLVDVSQLSKTATMQVLSLSTAPFKAYLFDSSDEALVLEIRAARKTAGLREDYYYPFELYWEIEDTAVQMAFLQSVSGLLDSVGVEEVVNHIDYIVQRIGIDHVGIGSDFNHGSGIDGFLDASDTPNVTKALVARSYSRQGIEKIRGGNLLRVFCAAQSLAE